MGTEIELRFRVGPEVWRRLTETTTTGAGTLGAPTTRDLDSTYFDLPDHALGRQGIGVRVRADGADRVLTIKRGAGDAARLGARREWNLPQIGDTPDLARLRRHLPAEALAGPLAPVFRTRVQRVTRLLEPRPGARIELALDHGRLIAGRRGAAIRELELELVAGRPRDLYTAALALHRELGPFQMQPATKSERGYALARGEAAPAFHAEPVVLAPDQTTESACKAILRACLAQIVANQEVARLGTDVEGVHQMRVGVRRLRAALSWLARLLPDGRRKSINAEFRWFAQELGPARDWDVFIGERLGPAIARGGLGDAAVGLPERAGAERVRAYRRARRAIGSARYTAAVLDTLAWLEEPWTRAVKKRRRARLERPIADQAWRVLRDADTAVRDLGAPPVEGDAAALHAVRIAAKKARYAAECLESVAPESAVGPYVKALKRVQEAFGQSNDAARAADMIARLAGEGAVAPALAEAVTHPRGAPRTQAKMLEAWRDYRDTMPIHCALGHGF